MAIDINSLTKRYANPWDTSFDYLDPTGMMLGTGYDSYQDAIRKSAFTSGLKQYEASSNYDSEGNMSTRGLYGYDPFTAGYGFRGAYKPAVDDRGSDSPGYAPEQRGQVFQTQQELWDYMNSDPTSKEMLSYDAREKYGRQLTEGQQQNMYALLNSQYAPNIIEQYGGVPDWTYHRGAYEAAWNPIAGINVSGANALVGSTPVFGADGKITGYKINLNPEHINGADTSGRVQSSTGGSTTFNQNLRDYATPIDANTAFIPVGNIDKFGYTSSGQSSYSKAPTMWSQLAEMGTKAFLGAAVGGAFGFGPLAVGGEAASSGLGALNSFDTGAMTSALGGGSGAAGTGAAAGGSMDWSDLLSGLGDTTADLGGGWDWNTALSGLGDTPMPTSSLADLQQAASQYGWSDAAALNPDATGSSWLNNLYQSAVNDPLGTASKALRGLQSSGLLSGGLQAVGGYLSGNAATDAAKTASQAQLEAARIAADAAKFKPVGVTTRFGQSNFTKDAQGNVTNAGYTMPTDIRAMQDSLLGAAPGMLSQFTGSQAATAPMGVGAQRAMSLGNQYLNTDPLAQAQKYYDDQQAIMATGRARDQAGALTGEFNRGTYGLATGATGMMGAANPRLEAMYNAQRQQDLQASANATQGGMDYAKFGAGMVGTGGNLLRDMYGTQSAAYSPFGTALAGAQNIEGLGQNALDLSVNMGKVASPAQSGQLLANGMLGAAQTMQQANQYSPWGTALMNAGNALGSMQQPQQQQTSGYMFNPFTGVRL